MYVRRRTPNIQNHHNTTTYGILYSRWIISFCCFGLDPRLFFGAAFPVAGHPRAHATSAPARARLGVRSRQEPLWAHFARKRQAVLARETRTFDMQERDGLRYIRMGRVLAPTPPSVCFVSVPIRTEISP